MRTAGLARRMRSQCRLRSCAVSSMEYTRVAVVGCGTIGASWAGLFARAGLQVTLFDNHPPTAAAGLAAAQSIAGAGAQLELAPSIQAAVADAQYVQESVQEEYSVKAAVWRAVEAHSGPGAVLGSSTSGLRVSRLQEAVGPELGRRSLVAHPFNPPHLLRLVELVPGPATERSVVKDVAGFFGALGKAPVVLEKEVDGHIANRLQAAVWREAISLVANGVASVEDVDRALHEGPGVRWALMGMHQVFDLGGGEAGYQGFYETIGKGCFEPCWADMDVWSEPPPGAVEKIHEQLGKQRQSRSEAIDFRDQGLKAIVEWKDKWRSFRAD